jgi:1-deoxyxylulose-5-phosphate synthase
MSSFSVATDPTRSAGRLVGKEKIVFGTAALGMAYGLPRVGEAAAHAPSQDDVQALIDHSLALGIDTFDTAPAYGASEERLGRALRGRGRVWTKVRSPDPPATSLTRSLEHLGQRPHVDVLQWHNWTASLLDDASWRSAWSALRAHDSQRVKRLGATTYGKVDAVAALTSGLFDIVQVEFNLLNQGVVESLAKEDRKSTTRISVRSVYLQGALTDEGRSLPDRPALRQGALRAKELALKSGDGGGLTHLALRAAIDHPAIDYVVLGFDRAEQIDIALSMLERPLAAEVRDAIPSLDLGGDPAADPRTWSTP